MMSDEPYEPYGLRVELMHPSRPTVVIGLTWPEEQDDEVLIEVGRDLARHAVNIGKQMGEGEHEVP